MLSDEEIRNRQIVERAMEAALQIGQDTGEMGKVVLVTADFCFSYNYIVHTPLTIEQAARFLADGEITLHEDTRDEQTIQLDEFFMAAWASLDDKLESVEIHVHSSYPRLKTEHKEYIHPRKED